MAERSTIEWTDATWNPVTGCTKVSPGRLHCDAQQFAERFRAARNLAAVSISSSQVWLNVGTDHVASRSRT